MPLIAGTPDDDVLNGTSEGDVIRGLAGNDTLSDTLGGNDELYGNEGNDLITVARTNQASAILIDGGDDKDWITFTATSVSGANIQVLGGVGNDVITTSVGGPVGSNVINVHAGDGDDVVRAFGTGQTVTLGAGQDVCAPGQNTTITDFQAGNGGDRLDFTSKMEEIAAAGGGGLGLEQRGADVYIYAGYRDFRFGLSWRFFKGCS